MLTIPYGVQDDMKAIKKPLRDTVIKGVTYGVLEITYPPNIGTDTWFYYYKKGVFKFCDFYHDPNLKNGERIVFEGEQVFKNHKISKTWVWYKLPEVKFLYADTLKYINPVGDE